MRLIINKAGIYMAESRFSKARALAAKAAKHH